MKQENTEAHTDVQMEDSFEAARRAFFSGNKCATPKSRQRYTSSSSPVPERLEVEAELHSTVKTPTEG